ncbi:MAG: hypothetical protein H7230_01880 [Candidatus Parcubacteria bacterium]|nr:hypothetical protein [Candidatus Paceibacterota bacterium]
MPFNFSKKLQSLGLSILIGIQLIMGLGISSIQVQAGGPVGGGGTPTTGNLWPNYFPVDKTIVVDKIKITALSPNLNSDKTKNRINLFFYRTANDTGINQLKSLIVQSIKTPKPVNYFTQDYGMFDTEPLRSNMDKFNFWFFEGIIPKSDTAPFETAIRENPSLTGLDFVLPVTLQARPAYDPNDSLSQRESASVPNLAYSGDHTQITEYLPGSVAMFYDPYGGNSNTISNLSQETLLHELGHAIFGLADEYIETGTTEPIFGYPNCASSLGEASLWWGGNLGKVDPFFYEYRDGFIQGATQMPDAHYRYNNGQLQESYSSDPSIPRSSWSWRNITKNQVIDEEQFRVTLTNKDGCFSDKPNNGAFRPTNTSFMLSPWDPIFGSVNRSVSEQILNLFNKSTPPLKPKIPILYYDNIKNFQFDGLSPANCQVIIQGDKKTLNCSFENQNNMMSEKVKISYGLKEFDPAKVGADDGYTFDPSKEKVSTCRLESGVLKFVCEGLDISNLNLDKEYLLGLAFDASQVFISNEDPLSDGRIGSRIIFTTKSVGNLLQFKIAVLDTKILPAEKIITKVDPIITPLVTVITPVLTPIIAKAIEQKAALSIPTVKVLSKTGTSADILVIGGLLIAGSVLAGALLRQVNKNQKII